MCNFVNVYWYKWAMVITWMLLGNDDASGCRAIFLLFTKTSPDPDFPSSSSFFFLNPYPSPPFSFPSSSSSAPPPWPQQGVWCSWYLNGAFRSQNVLLILLIEKFNLEKNAAVECILGGIWMRAWLVDKFSWSHLTNGSQHFLRVLNDIKGFFPFKRC